MKSNSYLEVLKMSYTEDRRNKLKFWRERITDRIAEQQICMDKRKRPKQPIASNYEQGSKQQLPLCQHCCERIADDAVKYHFENCAAAVAALNDAQGEPNDSKNTKKIRQMKYLLAKIWIEKQQLHSLMNETI